MNKVFLNFNYNISEREIFRFIKIGVLIPGGKLYLIKYIRIFNMILYLFIFGTINICTIYNRNLIQKNRLKYKKHRYLQIKSKQKRNRKNNNTYNENKKQSYISKY